MARADYFDRAIQAAIHVIGGLDQEAFLEKVDSHRVGVAFDSTHDDSEAFAAVELFIRLSARFYPKMAIVALNENAEKLRYAMEELATRINPNISITRSLADVRDLVVVGATAVPPTNVRNVLYVGSDGWVARLSSLGPVNSGKTSNPLGAGFAACLAAANIFRGLFTLAPRDRELTISVLDLDPDSRSPANPSIAGLDIGEVFLVGAGAIGNGFLWALSHSGVKGELAIVDHEHLDLSNLQRYVLTLREHVDILKTKIAQEAFSGRTEISIRPVPHRWQDLMDVLTPEQWRLLKKVVVALDTPEDRIFVQASLPYWIVNAWTQQGEFGVSRHSFLGDQACLACLYMPRGPAPHLDELIAEALGFPAEQLMRVRTMIETAQPLDLATLQEIASAKNISLEKLRPFEGKPIQTLYTQGVCGSHIFELSGGPVAARAEVPMPFQSAAAGILQVAALFAHVAGHAPNPTITQIDLMRPFPSSRMFSRYEQKVAVRCICGDADYQEAFKAKHSIA